MPYSDFNYSYKLHYSHALNTHVERNEVCGRFMGDDYSTDDSSEQKSFSVRKYIWTSLRFLDMLMVGQT